MPRHRLFIPGIRLEPEGRFSIEGEEARHAARVKRVAPGDTVEVLDGSGTVGLGRVGHASRTPRGEWVVEGVIESVSRVPPVVPQVEVWSAVPKGDRVEGMIDALSQAGAGAWGPLSCAREVVVPRGGKLERLRRRAIEASKQCGRAWIMDLVEGGTIADAFRGASVVLADASGTAYHPTGTLVTRVLVGPEGGWTDEEVESARARGASVARFGPHAMRIEVAAVVAAGIVLDAESRAREGRPALPEALQ